MFFSPAFFLFFCLFWFKIDCNYWKNKATPTLYNQSDIDFSISFISFTTLLFYHRHPLFFPLPYFLLSFPSPPPRTFITFILRLMLLFLHLLFFLPPVLYFWSYQFKEKIWLLPPWFSSIFLSFRKNILIILKASSTLFVKIKMIYACGIPSSSSSLFKQIFFCLFSFIFLFLIVVLLFLLKKL